MNLSFDEKAKVACLLAEYCDPIVVGEHVLGGEVTYDAVSWACWDSVELAL